MNNLYKIFVVILALALLITLAFGFDSIGDKSASMSIIYGAAAVVSLLILAGYGIFHPRKDRKFIFLFTSVLVVNTGYFNLSISETLESALWANRLSYFGSVFLPLAMLLIIANAANTSINKKSHILLLIVSIFVFLISASPGYLDIYYKDVSLEIVDGVSVLNKVYGPWHKIYLFYLVGYFGSMLTIVVRAIIKKRTFSVAHSVLLLSSVFINILVWLMEQIVKIDFEFLSISYIITELFLLGLDFIIAEHKRFIENAATKAAQSKGEIPSNGVIKKTDPEFENKCAYLLGNLGGLTPTERIIYDYYINGVSTKDIMKALNITENTLKYHNKNIYSKLGVSSRKQLVEISNYINAHA